MSNYDFDVPSKFFLNIIVLFDVGPCLRLRDRLDGELSIDALTWIYQVATSIVYAFVFKQDDVVWTKNFKNI